MGFLCCDRLTTMTSGYTSKESEKDAIVKVASSPRRFLFAIVYRSYFIDSMRQFLVSLSHEDSCTLIGFAA